MINITQSTMIQRKKSQRCTVEELKKKYESLTKSPNKIKKSNVKRMASIYNAKVTQLIKSDIEKGKYMKEKGVVDDDKIQRSIKRSNRDEVPEGSPRTNSKGEFQKMSLSFATEDSLSKLTVKDKKKLFDQLVMEGNLKRDLEDKENDEVFEEEKAADKTLKTLEANEKISEISSSEILPTSSTKASPSGIFPAVPALIIPNIPDELLNLVKQSVYEESDLELSALSSGSTDDLLSDIQKNHTENSETEFNFTIPVIAMRKKKLRRSSPLKKDMSAKYCAPFSSTDSETDSKYSETAIKTPLKLKYKETIQTPLKEVNSQHPTRLFYTPKANDLKPSLSSSLDLSPLDVVRQEYKDFKVDNPKSRSTSITFVNITDMKTFTKSFTDQGFETENNEMNFSLKTPQKCSPMKTPTDFLNLDKTSENTFEFSTPINKHQQPSFSCSSSAKQQLFSPIEKPMKHLRNDSELPPKIVAMQVIQEDQPLEHAIQNLTYNNSTQNEPTLSTMNSNSDILYSDDDDKISKFWIKCDNFSISLDIFYNDNQRLCLFYKIFSQTSCGNKDLYFGIDDFKFTRFLANDHQNISSRLPALEGQSHYWFSTGDLTIPFCGKYLSPQKIQCMFQFIRGSIERSGILRFGVDDVEFSNVCTLQGKLSFEEDTQSNSSTSFEDFKNYEWGKTKNVIVTDLDETGNKDETQEDAQEKCEEKSQEQSQEVEREIKVAVEVTLEDDLEEDVFEVIEPGRLSYTTINLNPSSSCHTDTPDSAKARKSSTHQRLESFCNTLDKLFDHNLKQIPDKKVSQAENTFITNILTVLQHQQQNMFQSDLPSCSLKASKVAPSKVPVENVQLTPDYLNEVRSIATDISCLISKNKLKELSFQQLENYIKFLSRYAEMSLNIVPNHKQDVFDALND